MAARALLLSGGAGLVALAGGCVIGARSLEPPSNDEATVALLSGTRSTLPA